MSTSRDDRLDGYDAVQLSLTCLSGVDRKMVVPTKKLLDVVAGKEDVAFKDAGIPRDSYIFDLRSSAGTAKVDIDSLKPLPWLTHDGHRVGGVFCELTPPTVGGEISPRSVALKQVARLKDTFGLTIKSALEAEFMIFEKDGRTPFNNVDREAYGRVDNMAGKEHCILDACFSLQKAGLPIETFLSEFAAGQFEMTFRPQEGVASADTIMLMKEGLRVSLGKYDLIPTFMTIPSDHGHANGFHLNHSLWSDEGVNEFIDLNDPIQISDTARHWIAGLIYHAPCIDSSAMPHPELLHSTH
ncbi:unnamed protein product [Candidula unifasciata]|uniref:Lengsin n=1 Tax=Candidula unifasciata TaxID=100452 RepID=A0A8S3ZYY0_9EUPU|nr:unnamed protein product [Candidula unifasciata]